MNRLFAPESQTAYLFTIEVGETRIILYGGISLVFSRLSSGISTRLIGAVVTCVVDWDVLLNQGGIEDSPGRDEAKERARLRSEAQEGCRRRKKGKRK